MPKAKAKLNSKKKPLKPKPTMRIVKVEGAKIVKTKNNKCDTNGNIDSLGRDRTSVADKTAKNKEKILVELTKTFGIVTNAIAKARIDNSTFYRWYRDDKEFAKAVEEIQDGFDIIVEDKLKQKIIQNDGHSIRFYLSHRVKKYRPKMGLGQDEDLEPIQMTIVTRKTKPDDKE